MSYHISIKSIPAIGIIVCMFLQTSFGQRQAGPKNDKMREKIEAKKIAYLSQKLDLSTSEAEKFWPVYNAYSDEIESLHRAIDFKPEDDLNDAQAETMLNQLLDMKSKEISIQKTYVQKMKSAISPKKIAMLFRYEREFREQVFRKMKERRE